MGSGINQRFPDINQQLSENRRRNINHQEKQEMKHNINLEQRKSELRKKMEEAVRAAEGHGGASVYKAAVFDYDGTVVDSMKMWSSVPSRFARRLGVEAEPGFDEEIKYLSLEESAQRFREYGAVGSDEEIIEQIMEMVMESYQYELQLKPGVRNVLEDLYTHNIRMCVASQTPSRMIQAANRRLGLDRYFEAVYSCGEWETQKREPDIYYLAADHLGALPQETFVFEDMVYAVKTAADAGFYVVGIYDESSEEDRETIEQNSRIYLRNYAEWFRTEFY